MRIAGRGAQVIRSSPEAVGDVDDACVAAGRGPATLERPVSVIIGGDGRTSMAGVPVPLFTGDTSQIVDELLAYTRQGITQLQVGLEPNTLASIEQFGPVSRMLAATLR